MPAWVERGVPKLHIPVRVIWGLEDKALLPIQLEGIGEVGDDVEVFPLKGVGHFAPWEAPDAGGRRARPLPCRGREPLQAAAIMTRSISRSAARLAAVQALYQQEMEGTPTARLIHEFHDHRLGATIEGDDLCRGGNQLLRRPGRRRAAPAATRSTR